LFFRSVVFVIAYMVIMDDSLAERQKSSVISFLEALNKADLAGIEAPLSDSAGFRHQYLPRTLGVAAAKSSTRAEMMTVMKHTFENVVWKMGIEIPLTEVVQDRQQEKMVVLLTDRGISRAREGVQDGQSYDIQYVIFFAFEKGTDRICE
jgi:hypothetical protein